MNLLFYIRSLLQEDLCSAEGNLTLPDRAGTCATVRFEVSGYSCAERNGEAACELCQCFKQFNRGYLNTNIRVQTSHIK